MGEVFVAEDTKLHRRVALKVLPEKFAKSPSRRERFEREARAVAALDHPNIVTIFSVEEMEGVHFITMQLLEGELLSSRIPPDGLEVQEFLRIALPLADALAAAHQKGITHRDIKPKNILITHDGTVKVLDFGLAKLDVIEATDQEAELETLELTEPGTIMGTAAYMSPEQLQGEPIDSRSDLFSLGVVLYQMATGRRPFRGRTAIAVASSILRDTPESITKVRKELPNELGRIVGRCLEVEREHRFQTAADIRNELDDLRGQIEGGSSLLTGWHATVPAGGSSFGRTLAGLALVVLLIAGYLLWPRADPTAGDGPLKIVVLPLENLGPESEEYFAAGITDEITSRLASVSGLRVTSRTSAMQYRSERPAVREIGRTLGVDYILEGTVRWSGLGQAESKVRITPKLVRVDDDTQLWAQPFTFDIDDIFQVQTKIAESVVARLGATLLEPERASLAARPTDNIDAYQAYLEGIYKVRRPVYTLPNWNAAVESFERAVALDPEFATAWAELATAHGTIVFLWLEPGDERREAARRAVERAEELEPDSATTRLALANFNYMVERDYDRALVELDRAAGDRAHEVEVLKTRGYVLRRQGNFTEAISVLERAIALDPRDATTASEVGETYEFVRNLEQAIRYYGQSIALDPTQTYSYYSAARAHWVLGDSLAPARELLEEMPVTQEAAPFLFQFWQLIYERNYPGALEHLESSERELFEYWDGLWPKSLLRGLVEQLTGDVDAARDSFVQAVEVLEPAVAEQPWDPRRYGALAFAYAGLGRSEQARQAAQHAAEIYPFSEDAYSGTTPLLELAMVRALTGQTDESLELVEQLLAIPSNLSTRLIGLDPRFAPLLETEPYAEMLAAESRETAASAN